MFLFSTKVGWFYSTQPATYEYRYCVSRNLTVVVLDLFSKRDVVFTFSIMPDTLTAQVTGKTMACLSSVSNTVFNDVFVIQGARASATIVLIKLSRIIPFSAIQQQTPTQPT